MYQHYYKGIEVEYSEVREHVDPITNSVILTNGRYVEGLNLTNTPGIPEEIVLNFALDHLNSDTFAWQCDSMELWIKEDTLNEDTTYYPEGRLIYAFVENNSCDTCYTLYDTSYRLAWVFSILSVVPSSNVDVFVDAMTGEIIRVSSRGFGNDNFDHIYYGRKQLDHRWFGGWTNKYYLIANDDCRDIWTRDMLKNNSKDNGRHHARNNVPFINQSSNGDWGVSHQEETSAHFVVQKAWGTFSNVFHRNGIDDNNIKIGVTINHPEANTEGAAFSNTGGKKHTWQNFIFFGKGKSVAVYDIAGHEFGHGVLKYTANPIARNEPGAVA